jgi:hypothetical protein
VLHRAAALFALAIFPILAPAAEQLLLAPGKSVTVVDENDPSVRTVVTAPASEPLDLGQLIAAAAGNVQSLAILQQAKPAATLVRNPDGSVSLGAPARAREGRVIERGVIVVRRGGYTLQEKAAPGHRQAADPIVEYTFGRDNVGLPVSVDSLRTRVPPAVVPNLPPEMRKAN